MPLVSSNRIGNRLSDHVNRKIPKNSVALMRSIEVVCAGQVIGYIQNIKPSEDRAMFLCREVGNEDPAELVPGGPDNLSITVQRMLLYRSRMMNIFDDFAGLHGNQFQGIRSLMDFNAPFDVMVLMRRHYIEGEGMASLDGGGDQLDHEITGAIETASGEVAAPVVILDLFHECWFSSVSYSVDAARAEFQIVEDATIKYTWRTGSPLYQPPALTMSNYAGYGELRNVADLAV